MKYTLKAIDFFCGIGGVTQGLLNAGIDVLAGIDHDRLCRGPYEKNNIRRDGSQVPFFCEDIRKFNTNLIKKQINRKKDKLIIIGCAPCQPFTYLTGNLAKRREDRELLPAFADIIHELKPDYLFIENVSGLSQPRNKEILNRFIQLLQPEFNLSPKIINAADFGIPQKRKRLILFGKRNSDISYPLPTHKGDDISPYVTVHDELFSLPPIRAGEIHPTLRNHECCKTEPISLDRMQHQQNDGDGMETWPEHLLLHSRQSKQYKGHTDVYGRLWWNRPSVTLTTKFVSLSNGRFAHPEQNRGLSIREGLLIQSFPPDYIMDNLKITQKARQIGNAVPVKLAEAFAKRIVEDCTVVKRNARIYHAIQTN